MTSDDDDGPGRRRPRPSKTIPRKVTEIESVRRSEADELQTQLGANRQLSMRLRLAADEAGYNAGWAAISVVLFAIGVGFGWRFMSILPRFPEVFSGVAFAMLTLAVIASLYLTFVAIMLWKEARSLTSLERANQTAVRDGAWALEIYLRDQAADGDHG